MKEKLSTSTTTDQRSSSTDDDWSADASDGLLSTKEQHQRRHQEQAWFSGRRALLIHAGVFLFYLATIVGLGVMLGRTRTKARDTILFSPANEAVDWTIEEFKSGDGLTDLFIGPPRPDLEKAWADLLAPMNVRLSYDDVKAFGREGNAVQMSDGSGYVGSLHVYHELHCVRLLYKYIWSEVYYPDADEEQQKHNKGHTQHCLNALRRLAVCHGDVGLIIYSWQSDTLKPGANGTAHQCVDWQKLSGWANERTVDMYKPGLLVHPLLGQVYQ
ncbi:hypothetical protein F4677DRAFT_382319 [Hypoxylon crocopeplum]|nr:hypothetical protein F4677DRAFT_382319 [Hypoxylon crocopeplum]